MDKKFITFLGRFPKYEYKDLTFPVENSEPKIRINELDLGTLVDKKEDAPLIALLGFCFNYNIIIDVYSLEDPSQWNRLMQMKKRSNPNSFSKEQFNLVKDKDYEDAITWYLELKGEGNTHSKKYSVLCGPVNYTHKNGFPNQDMCIFINGDEQFNFKTYTTNWAAMFHIYKLIIPDAKITMDLFKISCLNRLGRLFNSRFVLTTKGLKHSDILAIAAAAKTFQMLEKAR